MVNLHPVVQVMKASGQVDERVREITGRLKERQSEANVLGMERFGIVTRNAYGVPIPILRALAREYRMDHELAQALWRSGVHESHLLAALIDDPNKVDREQMEEWVSEFYSWDVCDGVVSNLFDRTTQAWSVIPDWCRRAAEYERRAGFVMIAALATHDKRASDERFLEVLPLTVEGADDERKMVMKAVNWAVRGVGKRNAALNEAALETAERIKSLGTRPARWIAADAIRELKSEAVRRRLSLD